MTAAEWLARARAVTDEPWPDATVIAETKVYLPAAVAAIEAVLTLHVPVWNCGGNGYHCDECGTDLTDATPDCPTVRAITAALDLS